MQPMTNTKRSKLTLNAETERYLGPEALADVYGGCCSATGYIPCSCIPANTSVSWATGGGTSACSGCA